MIKDTLTNKNYQERCLLKSQELAKVGTIQKRDFGKRGYKFEITSIQELDGIVEVYIKAWNNANKKIGFGKDGTVEVERIRIVNPPILVADPLGDIVEEYTNRFTGQTVIQTFREDPGQALFEIIEDTIHRTGKNDEKIIRGKVGRTTTVVFSNAGGDGGIYGNATTFAGVRALTTGTNEAGETTAAVYTERAAASDWWMERGFFPFDSSGLPDTDTVSAAILSLWGGSKWDEHNDANSFVTIVESTQASNTALANADYNDVGSTKLSDDIDITAFSITGYNDFTLNASGLALVSKTSFTKLAIREGHDFNNVAHTTNGIDGVVVRSANFTGTTNDPKLTITHAAAAETALVAPVVTAFTLAAVTAISLVTAAVSPVLANFSIPAATPTYVILMAELQENFEFGGNDSGKWDNWGGAQVVDSTNLRCELTSTLGAGYYGKTSLAFYDLTESYAFSEALDAGNQSIPSFEFYPITLDNDDNGLSIMIAGGNVHARKKVSGSSSTVGSSITYNSATMKWFRIRESGGTTFWEYATDPTSTWTEIASESNPIDVTALKGGILIGTWQEEGSATTAIVDNFNVLPGEYQFDWKGHTWHKRIHKGDVAAQHWSPGNVVEPDGNDYIALKLTNPTLNQPAGCEIFSDQRGFGYGTYIIVVGTRLDNAHAALGFGGLFTFDFTAPPDYKEIDVNETRNTVGGEVEENKQILKNHVWNNGGDREFVTDNMDIPADVVQTHRLIWEAGKLTFDSFIGEGVEGVNYMHNEHTTHIPIPGLERVHFNIFADTGVSGYEAVTPLDVVIRDFSFTQQQLVTPAVMNIALPAVTASYTQTETASVSPITASFAIPNTTAQVRYTASVSPVITNFTPPAATALYEQINAASVAPVVMNTTVPVVTAAYIQEEIASVDPATTVFSLPLVTADHSGAATASVTPIVVTYTIIAATASHIQIETASTSPVVVNFILPSISAQEIYTTNVIPVEIVLTPSSVTATHDALFVATVSPLQATYTVPPVTAAYLQAETVDAASVVIAITVSEVEANTGSATASVVPVVLNLSASLTTASYIQINEADSSLLTVTFTVSSVTAASQAIYTASVDPASIVVTPSSVTAEATGVSANTIPGSVLFSSPSIVPTYEAVLTADISPVSMVFRLSEIVFRGLWIHKGKTSSEWELKEKIAQQEAHGEILTPDGQQILVGENEDEVLIYEEGFNNWQEKTKETADWTLKPKQDVDIHF